MKALPPDNTTTASEAHLASLCRRTFLRYWSYPGLYRDKRVGHRGDGKEICDLLVLFEDDVFIFSDKHCALKQEGAFATLWARWYKKAVLEAADQIEGAEKWLANNPGRVFLDRACKEPFPLALPCQPRFHRIVTCRGSAEASLKVFGGTGSLLVTNHALADCSDRPMHLGAFTGRGTMVHVLDEVALEVLLTTFDTAPDLRDYLVARERFFLEFDAITAAGEDELVGYHLTHYREECGGYGFHFDLPTHNGEASRPTMITIDEGFWSEWSESARCQAKREADKISYGWDDLAEKFTFHTFTGTQDFASHTSLADNEKLLRWMAREPRTRRRMLARALLDAMLATGPGQLRRLLVFPSGPDDPLWVFLVWNRPPDIQMAKYRGMRRNILTGLCQAAKAARPDINDVAGIAVGVDKNGMDEDLFYMDTRNWTEDMLEAAAALRDKLGLFMGEPQKQWIEFEFPQLEPEDA
jgi:hypothetical protein